MNWAFIVKRLQLSKMIFFLVTPLCPPPPIISKSLFFARSTTSTLAFALSFFNFDKKEWNTLSHLNYFPYIGITAVDWIDGSFFWIVSKLFKPTIQKKLPSQRQQKKKQILATSQSRERPLKVIWNYGPSLKLHFQIRPTPTARASSCNKESLLIPNRKQHM